MLATIATRGVIVLVVFPVIGHAIYSTMTWLLGRALPALTIAEVWVTTVDRSVVWVTVVVALLGSWNVCRRLWPASPVPRPQGS